MNEQETKKKVSEYFLITLAKSLEPEYNRFLSDALDIILKDDYDLQERVLEKIIRELHGDSIRKQVPNEIRQSLNLKPDFNVAPNWTKIVENIKKMGDAEYHTFLNGTYKQLDYSAYLKIFGNMASTDGFLEAITKKYKQSITVDTLRTSSKFFKKSVNIRNCSAHKTDTHIKEYTDDTKKEEAIKTLTEIYKFLKCQKLAFYNSRIERILKRLQNIIISTPFTIDELAKFAPKIANEQFLQNIYCDEYNAKEHVLYYLTKEEIIEREKIIYYGENIIIKDSLHATALSFEKNKAEMALMKKYAENFSKTGGRTNITADLWKEIAKNAVVLYDTSTLLPDTFISKHREYALDAIAPILKENNSLPVVDYSVRVELNRMSEGVIEGLPQSKMDDARHTRNSIDNLQGIKLLFLKKPAVLFKKGCYGIADLVNKNPDTRFVVLSQDIESQQYINENTNDNCLVVSTFSIPTVNGRVVGCSASRIRRFALGNFNAVIDTEDDLITEADDFTVIQSTVSTESKAKKVDKIEKPTSTEKKNNKPSKKEPSNTTKNQPKKIKFDYSNVIKEDKKMLPCSIDLHQGSNIHTVKGSSYALGEVLGVGGEGTVYAIKCERVAKIYHKDSLTQNRYEKLKLLISAKVPSKELCYPQELIFNEKDEFVGYIMSKVPSNFVPLGSGVLKLGSKDVTDLVKKNNRLNGLDKWNRQSLIKLCQMIATVFDAMHKNGILMGDINQNNILVDCSNTNGDTFKIVDCDSFQIGSYPCPVGTDEFTSPEIYKREHTDRPQYGTFLRHKEDDEYALASLLFRILMLGQQPFASKGNDDNDEATARRNYNFSFRSEDENGADAPEGCYAMIWDNMPFNVRNAFVTVFKGKRTVSAYEWSKLFDQYITQIETKKYTDELKPYRYHESSTRKTAEIVCVSCGKKANTLKNRAYERIVENHVMPFCGLCKSTVLPKLKRNTEEVKCEMCGNKYQETQYYIYSHEYGDKMCQRYICPSCNEKVPAKCAVCSKLIETQRYKIKKYSRLYCSEHKPKPKER